MRLADMEPCFLDSSDGCRGVGVSLKCPCGRDGCFRLYVPFANPLDGSAGSDHGWQRTGDTFETLTLTPSILRMDEKYGDLPGCKWHGFITDGEVRTC